MPIIHLIADEPPVAYTSIEVDAIAHGFTNGDQVFMDGAGNWALAMANDFESVALGMVFNTNPDTFEVATGGIVPFIHGQAFPSTRYLSALNPGATVGIARQNVGDIIQAVYETVGADAVRILSQPVIGPFVN